MAVDSHGPMVVRERKGEDLPVKLVLALYNSVELDDASHGKSHTVSILPVRYIKTRGAALDLAGQEWEVHRPCRHKVGCTAISNLANKGFELFELLVRESRSPETDRKIWLRTRTIDRYRAVPAFVDTFG